MNINIISIVLFVILLMDFIEKDNCMYATGGSGGQGAGSGGYGGGYAGGQGGGRPPYGRGGSEGHGGGSQRGKKRVAENSISAKRNAYIEQHGQEDVNKIYHPEVSVQKQLIDDYKGKNKNFGTAHDTIVNNKTSIKPILDKIDENLWVDFIRGVFLLVVYCEVRSTALKINDGFIKFVLATQGYKIVNNIGR
uniref:Uncharacterized protein n=1 Tax=Meloidogyne hapla TaxID=6305 RepID=A0A1I8BW34_MELHA